jgi:hypothetical protein
MADKSKAALVDALQTIGELKAELVTRTAERDALQRDLTDAENQQTAISQVLQVINSSLGTLWTFDGECFQIAAQHGMPARVRELITEDFIPAFDDEQISIYTRLLSGMCSKLEQTAQLGLMICYGTWPLCVAYGRG